MNLRARSKKSAHVLLFSVRELNKEIAQMERESKDTWLKWPDSDTISGLCWSSLAPLFVLEGSTMFAAVMQLRAFEHQRT